MYKILLCCASGVTTNMLVRSIKESAKKQNDTVMCWAVAEKSIQYSWADADCVFVAPQSKAYYKEIKEMINGAVPCVMINDEDFVKMDGEAILQQAKQLINQK